MGAKRDKSRQSKSRGGNLVRWGWAVFGTAAFLLGLGRERKPARGEEKAPTGKGEEERARVWREAERAHEGEGGPPTEEQLVRRQWLARVYWWIGGYLAALALLCMCLAAIGFLLHYQVEAGPEQPIPFSHHVHAQVKQISCLMCHPEVTHTDRAGIPPLETCMLCHSRIIVTYPPIQNLRRHYFTGQPVVWRKVYLLPDFVYFTHEVHIHKGFDCGKCHGDVKKMDRIVLEQKFNMGFCIQCHRDENATHDCFTCHR